MVGSLRNGVVKSEFAHSIAVANAVQLAHHVDDWLHMVIYWLRTTTGIRSLILFATTQVPSLWSCLSMWLLAEDPASDNQRSKTLDPQRHPPATQNVPISNLQP